MKQVERASIMRIVSDLIKADGIIDSREISVLQRIREKYGIKKEDEILSTSITYIFLPFSFSPPKLNILILLIFPPFFSTWIKTLIIIAKNQGKSNTTLP